MSEPFKPEDFEDKYKSAIQPWQASNIANALDAKRWACPNGGAHEPRRDPLSNQIAWMKCDKCGASLKAKWEAVNG